MEDKMLDVVSTSDDEFIDMMLEIEKNAIEQAEKDLMLGN